MVRVLRKKCMAFCAVPNGGWRSRRAGGQLKREGVERGVPDILIFDRPAGRVVPWVGVGLEMKRRVRSVSRVSIEQKMFHERLRLAGWLVIVGYGAEDALSRLREVGYDV